LITAAGVFTLLLFVGVIPSYIRLSSSMLSYAFLFCAGVFLATALIHLTFSSGEAFSSLGFSSQSSLLAVLIGLLITQFLATLFFKTKRKWSQGIGSRLLDEEETPLRQDVTSEFPHIHPTSSPEDNKRMFDVRLTPAPIDRIHAAIGADLTQASTLESETPGVTPLKPTRIGKFQPSPSPQEMDIAGSGSPTSIRVDGEARDQEEKGEDGELSPSREIALAPRTTTTSNVISISGQSEAILPTLTTSSSSPAEKSSMSPQAHTEAVAISLLVIVFGSHSIFEGIAVGLQPTAKETVHLAMVLCLHKILEVLSFSLAIRQLAFTLRLKTCLIVALALPLPLGIITAVGAFEHVSWKLTAICRGTLDGLVAGAMLYIAVAAIIGTDLHLHDHLHDQYESSPAKVESDSLHIRAATVALTKEDTQFKYLSTPKSSSGWSKKRPLPVENFYIKNVVVAMGAALTALLILWDH
jgi:hypothetical protein